jgi:hypothetical protein
MYVIQAPTLNSCSPYVSKHDTASKSRFARRRIYHDMHQNLSVPNREWNYVYAARH